MEYKDYYKIMGLERTADQDEIKRTYRKLARKYHPDVSKEANAEHKFKELGEAYEVLKDPEKRAKYDQYGQYWKQQEQAQQAGRSAGAHQQHYHQGNVDESDFADFLNSIFRQRQQQQQAYEAQGQDIHATLTISLEDSFHGSEKTLHLQFPIQNEYGELQYQQRAIKVKIPKGVTNKQQIRLRGQGGKGQGQAARQGDLYIEITIAPHPFFKLENKDIYLQLPITPWEAALGASIAVPTLGGAVNLKIPKLSQTGKQMRLKGRGLAGNPTGDQYVTLEIVIPAQEKSEADKLYEQLAGIYSDYNPRSKLGVR